MKEVKNDLIKTKEPGLAEITGTPLLFMKGAYYDGWGGDWAKLSAEEVAQEFIYWVSIPIGLILPEALLQDQKRFIQWVEEGRVLL